ERRTGAGRWQSLPPGRARCYEPRGTEKAMSVDVGTVKRVARLARIAVDEAEAEALRAELNAILGFVAQLDQVDVAGVEPMNSVRPRAMRRGADAVTVGDCRDKVLANAPLTENGFFVVPKVIE